MQPKAYSYIRFSSPEQAKGDSYRRQREAAEAYCASQGLELVNSKEYLFFDKGRSAYKAKHLDDTGELARFLSYVENGTVAAGSYLIVESLDRLSREKVKDALPRFLDLLNRGINVYTSADQKLYTSDYNELDLIVSIVHMSLAHNESSHKGDRVAKAWKNKQFLARKNLTPYGASCPYWLKYEDSRYIQIPERVETIRKIFSLCQNGYGQRTIARMLNDDGISVFGSDSRNKSGAWGSSSVGKILCNRALLGEYQPTGLSEGVRQKLGDPICNYFPVVITEEEFYGVAKARNSRLVSKATKPAKNFNVWQGVAKCAICGESMHLVNKGKLPKGGKYLRCYGAAKGVCKNKLVKLDRSEAVFRELLAKVDSLSLIQDNRGSLQRALDVVEGKIQEVESRLLELQQQVLSLGARLPSSLVSVLSKLEHDLENHRKTRESIKGDLARERIVNKDDFFSKLDLFSFEGRARANSLVKGLDIIVLCEASSEAIAYTVEAGGKEIFNVLDIGGQLQFSPSTPEVRDRIALHGDNNSVYFILGGVQLDLEAQLEELESGTPEKPAAP